MFEVGLKWLVLCFVGWWMYLEVLLDFNNCIEVKGDKFFFYYIVNNLEVYDCLVYCWIEVLKLVDKVVGNFFFVCLKGNVYFCGEVFIEVVVNQCGICRFGEDLIILVLDFNCCIYDVENLYVVDSSFFLLSFVVIFVLIIIVNVL